MKYGFVNLDASCNINCRHFVEEFQGGVFDVPVRRRVIETAQSDLVRQAVRVLISTEVVRERWGATKADV